VQPIAVYTRAWRAAVSLLLVVSAVNLPALLAAVVFLDDPPVTPPVVIRTFLYFTVVPALAAWLVDRAAAGRAEIRDGTLVLTRRDLAIDVPLRSIVRLAPWRLPLPGPGLSLDLASGRRLRFAIRTDDPAALSAEIARAGGPPAIVAAAPVVYASTRRRRSGAALAAKFGGFALAPAAVLFNLDQHITYGGTLGQYYLEGLGPGLENLVLYWTTVAIYLVCWASLWRAGAEVVVLATSWLVPSWTPGIRRVVEVVCGVAYWIGVPALLVLRLAA
jgi:apolipoprotein N-acyltransferase